MHCNLKYHFTGNVAGGDGKASLASQCLTDSFSVTSPGGGTNPVLCGVNTGEHMYVDASDACNELNFQLGNSAMGVTAVATRSWSIKVTQVIYITTSTLMSVFPYGVWHPGVPAYQPTSNSCGCITKCQ